MIAEFSGVDGRIVIDEKKPSKKGLRADATVANTREEENTNRKTPYNTLSVSCLLENDITERKPENRSRRQT